MILKDQVCISYVLAVKNFIANIEANLALAER